MPPWLTQLINTSAGISNFLNGLGETRVLVLRRSSIKTFSEGVPGAPDVLNCETI